MITQPPFRLTDIALCCYLGLPSTHANIKPRPIAHHLPVRRVADSLQGVKLYAVVRYAFVVEQVPPLVWND